MMRTQPTAPPDVTRPAEATRSRPARAAQRAVAVTADRARRTVKLGVSSALFGVDTVVGAVVPRHRRGRRASGVILMYHDIPAQQGPRFERQCELLIAHARAADLADVQQRDGAWKAAVTFDDGFRSFADVAVPAMVSRGIPSTLFVPTEWSRAAETPKEPDGWPVPLTPAEVAALPASVELGSHSRNHAHLPSLDDAALEDELVGSRADLAASSGRAVRFHAFPFGEHDERVDLAARAAGYERCYGIVPTEVRGEEFVVGRIQVDPTDWPIEFRLKVLGAYRWMSWWISARDRARSRASTGARS